MDKQPKCLWWIKLLDKYTEQVFVHTGQNYDYELNEIFFETIDHMDCYFDPMSIHR